MRDIVCPEATVLEVTMSLRALLPRMLQGRLSLGAWVGPPRPPGRPDEALAGLLAEMFTADELRRWVELEPRVAGLGAALEGGSLAALCASTVGVYRRHGLLDAQTEARLMAARPYRAREIRAVGLRATRGGG